jgi:TolB-like protein/Tfp pilus assembly protein PilF
VLNFFSFNRKKGGQENRRSPREASCVGNSRRGLEKLCGGLGFRFRNPRFSVERTSAGLEERVQFLFADHTLDTGTRELRRNGVPIAVQPLVFDLLVYLMENRTRVVSKEDLLAALWDGRMVADSTLATHVNAARRAIGDSGEEQKLIRTVARKGLRFVGDVQLVASAAASAPAAAPSPKIAARPDSSRPAIAVLAFNNMSGEAAQDYFSDGISEDLITALSKLRWFFVVARNSSFSYKGRGVSMKQLADELGVNYVVEGSVRKDRSRVRITVQLIDVATGSHVWAERYDRELADVFAVQDEITEAIVATIEPQLYAAENFRARRKAPENLDAWELVMRALSHFWRMTREDNTAAQKLLEQAVAIDPNYAQALAVLAVSRTFGARMGWEDTQASAEFAERAGLVGLRADGEDPWAHLALGAAYSYLGRIEDSLACYETAISLNPSFSLAHGYYSLVLSWNGRFREAAEAARRALNLSPRDPFSAIFYGVAAYAAYVERDYAEAIRLSRESIRLRGDFVGGYRVLTAAAGMAGDKELAKSILPELRRVHPGISLAWVAQQLPLPLVEEREHFLEGLRRAGLE